MSGRLGDEREWLYDMVWYTARGTGADTRLISVPLVMECEWDRSYGKIEEDFEKLLVSNASTRLMICNTDPRYHAEMHAYFVDSINGFEQGRSGDRFLIATLREDPRDFWYNLIIRQ